jgi:hypothetical protein
VFLISRILESLILFFFEGDYMLTITKREQIGSIHGKAIYRVGAFQILPLAQNLSKLNENQVSG